MADEEEEGKDEKKSSEPKSSLGKLIISMVLLGIVFLGIFVFVSLKFIVPAIKGTSTEQTGDGEVKKEKPKTQTSVIKDDKWFGYMYEMESFVVNLAESDGKRFLKTTLTLELNGEERKKDIDDRKAQLRDLVITALSSKSFEELYTVEGKNRTRKGLVRRMNMVLKSDDVVNIYFTEFVIQ